MKRRTKIVCTLGPASGTKEQIKALIDAGMNVARLNCSHGDWATKHQWIEWIRELSGPVGPVAIMADLQGPKFRIGELASGQMVLKPGQTLAVGDGPNTDIPVKQEEILSAMAPGDRLLLGDGEVELKLGSHTDRRFEAKVVNGGLVKSHQGVTLVNKIFHSLPITNKDIDDITECVRGNVDFVALSYVKNVLDVRELRRVLDRLDPSIRICAKIETREAIKDLDEIVKVSDVVMVARGDLGLQMDIEDVPVAQKHIIEKCTAAGVPVITATQMLESMIVNARPTRAEATDVANAILDGTDAVMLSGETAAGQHPVECVRTMVRIAEKVEPLFDRGKLERRFEEHSRSGVSQTEAVAHGVNELAVLVKATAILTTTTSGQTARMVSKFRPKAHILCATWNAKTHAQMAIVWGVEAIRVDLPFTTDDSVAHAIDGFLRYKRVKLGDHIVLTAGVPAGTPGNTNLILSHVVK